MARCPAGSSRGGRGAQQVADGELHLTALTLLAPHLTEENHLELLALAKHRTKREVLRIVRRLDPQPTVRDSIEPLGPEPVASKEYVDLLERARDLLSHAVPSRSLEEVHLRALRLLVERLEKRKYGAPRPKPSVEHAPSESESTLAQSAAPSTSAPTPPVAASSTPRRVERSKTHAQLPRQRGAASVRREVRERDGLLASG